MNPRKKRLFWIAPLALVGMAVFVFLGGEIVKLLWNWMLPGLFGWPALTFWQALALLVLCRILFGGLGWRGMGGGRYGLRERMRERFELLTPEERERFRQRMRERCGFDPAPDAGQGTVK